MGLGSVSVLTFLLIALLGTVDYLTGFEISFAFFYLIPVTLISWYGGRKTGLLASVVSSIVWHVANHLAGQTYSHPWIFFWNTATRLGFFVMVTVLVSKVHELLRTEQRLSRLDSLTGAANSRSFYERARLEVARARRNGSPLFIAYIDLDNFKEMNDRFGHVQGDAALQTIVETIAKVIRSSDLLARLGGDEFALLLPETTETGGRQVVERLREVVLTRMKENGWPVTLSIGAATFYDPSEDVQEIIRTVDELMYRVKQAGKNHVQYRLLAKGSGVH